MLAAAGGWALNCSAVHNTAARSDVMLVIDDGDHETGSTIMFHRTGKH